MPMADEACLSAVTILSAPISRASERRVELTPDQFFDEPSHPIAHTALDRIKPVIEKVGRSLVSRRERISSCGNLDHGVGLRSGAPTPGDLRLNTETTPTKFQPLPLRHHDTGGFRLSAGTQTLNAVTGNYTGTTAIAAGADLVLIGGTNIAVSSGVADAGTFDISGNGNTSIARLTGTGGQVNLGANTLTVMGSGNFTTGTLGAVGDTGGLTVSGSGTQMVFSGVTGHYTGVTTIDAGTTLSLSKGSDISTSSNVVNNGTFAIASNGNTTTTSLSSTNLAAIVSLGSNTLTLSNARKLRRRDCRHRARSDAGEWHGNIYGDELRARD